METKTLNHMSLKGQRAIPMLAYMIDRQRTDIFNKKGTFSIVVVLAISSSGRVDHGVTVWKL